MGGPASDEPFAEDPDQALRRFTAEPDVADAVRRLGEESWFRLQSEESAHLVGLLLDLVERAGPVELVLANGSRPAGRIEALGRDLVAVLLDDGDLSLIGRPSRPSGSPPALPT